MPVPRCSPYLRACRRDSAPHLWASSGLALLLQSDRNAQKLNALVPRFPATRDSASDALSCHLIVLHHCELVLSTFVATSFITSCGKETAPRPRSALAPCSGSPRRHAPRTRGPRGRKKTGKRPKPRSYEETYERRPSPGTPRTYEGTYELHNFDSPNFRTASITLCAGACGWWLRQWPARPRGTGRGRSQRLFSSCMRRCKRLLLRSLCGWCHSRRQRRSPRRDAPARARSESATGWELGSPQKTFAAPTTVGRRRTFVLAAHSKWPCR